MSNPRHHARELAVQGIYQWLLNRQPVTQLIAQLPAVADDDAEAFDEPLYHALLHGIVAHADELDAQLARFVDRPVTALSPVEHAVLLLGAEELAHHPQVPYRVAINEAVELAKTFGGTDGHKYVNGVMDRLAVALRGAEAGSRARRG